MSDSVTFFAFDVNTKEKPKSFNVNTVFLWCHFIALHVLL